MLTFPSKTSLLHISFNAEREIEVGQHSADKQIIQAGLGVNIKLTLAIELMRIAGGLKQLSDTIL